MTSSDVESDEVEQPAEVGIEMFAGGILGSEDFEFEPFILPANFEEMVAEHGRARARAIDALVPAADTADQVSSLLELVELELIVAPRGYVSVANPLEWESPVAIREDIRTLLMPDDKTALKVFLLMAKLLHIKNQFSKNQLNDQEYSHERNKILLLLTRILNQVPLYVPLSFQREYLQFKRLIEKQKKEEKFDEYEKATLTRLENQHGALYANMLQYLQTLPEEDQHHYQLILDSMTANNDKIAYRNFAVQFIGGENHPLLKIINLETDESFALRTATIVTNLFSDPFSQQNARNVSSQHARLRLNDLAHRNTFLVSQYLFKSCGDVSELESAGQFAGYLGHLEERQSYFCIEACEFLNGVNLEERIRRLRDGLNAVKQRLHKEKPLQSIPFATPQARELIKQYLALRNVNDIESLNKLCNLIIALDAVEIIFAVTQVLQNYMRHGIVVTDIKPSNLFIHNNSIMIILGDAKSTMGPFTDPETRALLKLDQVKVSSYFTQASPSHSSNPATMVDLVKQTLFASLCHLMSGEIPPTDHRNEIHWQQTERTIYDFLLTNGANTGVEFVNDMSRAALQQYVPEVSETQDSHKKQSLMSKFLRRKNSEPEPDGSQQDIGNYNFNLLMNFVLYLRNLKTALAKDCNTILRQFQAPENPGIERLRKQRK